MTGWEWLTNGAAWHTMADMDNDTRMVVRLPDWLRQLVKELATTEDRSEAAMMRILVFEAINARRGPDGKVGLA